MIWSSPVQQSSITHLATLPQMYLAFTVDLEGTVKVWNCQDQDALATFPVSQACFSLEVCLTKDGPFLMVSEPCIWRAPTKQNACCLGRCCGPITVTSQSIFLESSLSCTLRVKTYQRMLVTQTLLPSWPLISHKYISLVILQKKGGKNPELLYIHVSSFKCRLYST